MFGDNFSYTDSSEPEFGAANCSFQSFRQASLENEYARFYGGIRYFPGNTVAHECGKNIGGFNYKQSSFFMFYYNHHTLTQLLLTAQSNPPPGRFSVRSY